MAVAFGAEMYLPLLGADETPVKTVLAISSWLWIMVFAGGATALSTARFCLTPVWIKSSLTGCPGPVRLSSVPLASEIVLLPAGMKKTFRSQGLS